MTARVKKKAEPTARRMTVQVQGLAGLASINAILLVILARLDDLERGQKEMRRNMVTKADFDAAMADLASSIANVAADIDELISKLTTGGMTEAEEAQVLADLQAQSDALKSVASKYQSAGEQPPTP